ncbi:hypothetical protein HMPREF0541_01917 [Lacticaseibacillus rhamnosus ATCC 21052]|nr:hypothetical protein HMPREF0541_01917 [Lacticaseibacillus rhamnosus ATCC 21052]
MGSSPFFHCNKHLMKVRPKQANLKHQKKTDTLIAMSVFC